MKMHKEKRIGVDKRRSLIPGHEHERRRLPREGQDRRQQAVDRRATPKLKPPKREDTSE